VAKLKAKVKSRFTHQGKTYEAGQDFEGEDHEIQTLATQGHLEHPPGSSQTIGHEHGPGGQAQGQGAQPGGQGQTGPHDPPPKQGR